MTGATRSVARSTALSMALRIGAAIATVTAAGAAGAVELPTPAAAREQLAQDGVPTEVVTVLEPHLTRKGRMPEVRYVGFPADAALAKLLGPDWNAAGRELEFRALDGFVSRIPVERFAQHRAWLVIAREDGRPFQVDNHLQGEQQVPLGPFYLVWDNRRSKALQAEGGALWPYQVGAVSSGPSSTRALLPGGLARRYGAAADLARTNCLSCHRIRGYGGDKMPLDLDVAVKGFDAAAWRRWLLTPSAVRPGTTMPPLAEGRSEADRAAMAQQLYDYLRALPAR
jgi:mono/diheme cytochrome c family protein